VLSRRGSKDVWVQIGRGRRFGYVGEVGLYVYDSREVLRSWDLAVGDLRVVMVIIIITQEISISSSANEQRTPYRRRRVLLDNSQEERTKPKSYVFPMPVFRLQNWRCWEEE